jgi:hypothetical protein
VEVRLFSVPKAIFERDNTSTLKAMFSYLPQKGPIDGSDDKHRLILPSLSPDDFNVFIKVSMARYVHGAAWLKAVQIHSFPLTSCSIIGLPPDLGLLEWMVVLRLADMWQMDDLRALSIEKMEPKFDASTYVDQLLVAKKYQIESWVPVAENRLISCSSTLSTEEAQKLGIGTAMKIMRVCENDLRQKLTASRAEAPSPINTRKPQGLFAYPDAQRRL